MQLSVSLKKAVCAPRLRPAPLRLSRRGTACGTSTPAHTLPLLQTLLVSRRAARAARPHRHPPPAPLAPQVCADQKVVSPPRLGPHVEGALLRRPPQRGERRPRATERDSQLGARGLLFHHISSWREIEVRGASERGGSSLRGGDGHDFVSATRVTATSSLEKRAVGHASETPSGRLPEGSQKARARRAIGRARRPCSR